MGNGFTELVGQPQAVELLTQAIAKQRIAPAYLFAGIDGVGRGVAARGLIECLFRQDVAPKADEQELQTLRSRIHQGNHPDMLWVEPTYVQQNKRYTAAEAAEAGLKLKSKPLVRLEQIRDVTRFLARSPLETSRSVVVIEHAETMAEATANALLKTLEEPGQATIILLAPSSAAILPTLVSRCQKIPFYGLSAADMAHVLHQTGHSDMLQQPQVLQLAQGSPGAAIAHWQKLTAFPEPLRHLLAQPPRSYREALGLARQIEQTLEPEDQLWLIDYLQQCYWQQQLASQPNQFQQVLWPLNLLEQAREHLRFNVGPRLVWEVALMKMVG
jgi:DNA polymerase III subunit delta'